MTDQSDQKKNGRLQKNRAFQPHYSVGTGYDVHQFAKDRPLYLGGVLIPFDQGLLGHSDADVVLHALMDALLGACGLKDIGTYFPPEDSVWKDVRSTVLLEKVCDVIDEAGWVIGNLDATIIAEVPKVKPHIDQMKIVIGEISGLQDHRIAIKATTNESMGFVGRKEGIAVIASALCFNLSK